jgi:hypothetical protein
MSLYYLKPQNPKTPKTPRTQSAFGLLTIKDQSRPSYGRRPEVSIILEIVELGFEAFAHSIIFNLSKLTFQELGRRKIPYKPFSIILAIIGQLKVKN